MIEVLQYSFMQNAILASVLAALVCGLVGSFIVVRRMVFVSGGITHASFGGIGLGLYFGINPFASAAVFAVGSALAVRRLSRTGQIREDAAIAAIWAFGMAIGTLFMTLTPGYNTGLSSFLFGNILLVSSGDLYALSILALLVVTLFILAYRPILYVAFDSDFAHSRGINSKLIDYIMTIVTALSIVMSIRMVGIMLLLSLLTLPQSIMNLFSSNWLHMLIGSTLIALVVLLLGIWLSYILAVPSGASVILLLCLFFVIAKLTKKLIRC